MTPYSIYVTEPDVIDLAIVSQAMGDAQYTLTAGSTDFTVGDAAGCNTVLIRSATRIDSSITKKIPGLRHIVRVGVGLDNVDLDFCEQAGIAAYNAPGANADAVAEYATTMVLMALRRIHLLTRTDQETWNRHKFTGRSIAGRTVGIVGFGHIGRLLYAKLRALGCSNFLIYDPFVQSAPDQARIAALDELLSQSDIISLHLPLTNETKHIIQRDELALLQQGAILLNAARGGIVDETALLEIAQQKSLTYIADTVEGEPHPNPALLGQENIFITPHIASLTAEAETAMIHVAIENLLAHKPALLNG